MTRYRATITDEGGYISPTDMQALAAKALGREVLVLFTDPVGDVIGVGQGDDGVVILLESDRQDLGGLGLVPAFRDGVLDCFGVVPAPSGAILEEV